MAVIVSKQIVLPKRVQPCTVTITGRGNTSYCYATVNGTKYTAAAEIELDRDNYPTITFGVYGSKMYSGYVKIDDTTVASIQNNSVTTYGYTVPDDVTAISIALSYASSQSIYGRITVTTS